MKTSRHCVDLFLSQALSGSPDGAEHKGSRLPLSRPHQSLRMLSPTYRPQAQHLVPDVTPGLQVHLGSSLEPPHSSNWVKLYLEPVQTGGGLCHLPSLSGPLIISAG